MSKRTIVVTNAELDELIADYAAYYTVACDDDVNVAGSWTEPYKAARAAWYATMRRVLGVRSAERLDWIDGAMFDNFPGGRREDIVRFLSTDYRNGPTPYTVVVVDGAACSHGLNATVTR